jgi:hypothetical protein
MKLLAAIGTTGLFLLFGTAAAAYAPQDRPEQQDEKAKPEKKDEKAKPAKQDEKAQPAKQDERAKPAKQDEKAAKPEAKQAKPEERDKPTKQDARQAKPEQQDRPAQQQEQQRAQQSPRDGENRGGGSHGRITDDHYRASFGNEHHFRVNRGDYDNRRFEYGGYAFGFIDPWPSDWYYADDVYVVYDNGGYYMYDVVHPGIRISVNIL